MDTKNDSSYDAKTLISNIINKLNKKISSYGTKEDGGIYISYIKNGILYEFRFADHKAFLLTFANKHPEIRNITKYKQKYIKQQLSSNNQKFYYKYCFYSIVIEDKVTKGNKDCTFPLTIKECVLSSKDILKNDIDEIVNDIKSLMNDNNKEELVKLNFVKVDSSNNKSNKNKQQNNNECFQNLILKIRNIINEEIDLIF